MRRAYGYTEVKTTVVKLFVRIILLLGDDT